MKPISIIFALACAQLCVACSAPGGTEADNTPARIGSTSDMDSKIPSGLPPGAKIASIIQLKGDMPVIPAEQREEALAFTEAVANALRKELTDITTEIVVTEPLKIQLDSKLGVYLHSSFSKCRSDAAACSAEIDGKVKFFAPALRRKNVFDRRETVRLVIRADDEISRLQESISKDGHTLQVEPLLGGLLILAVYDRAPAIVPLDERDLEKLYVSHEQLFALGRKNLQDKLKPLANSAKAASKGEFAVINGSPFESSRLLLHSQWEPLAMAQQGTLLVALPTSDTVLYISESSPSAVAALRSSASSLFANNPKSLSTVVLRWTSKGWETAE